MRGFLALFILEMLHCLKKITGLGIEAFISKVLVLYPIKRTIYFNLKGYKYWEISHLIAARSWKLY